jgi:hypothetical protein
MLCPVLNFTSGDKITKMLFPLQFNGSDYLALVAIVTPVTAGILAAIFKLVSDIAVLKNDVRAIKKHLGLED